MRIVRKISRKKVRGKSIYEYERFLIPIPAKARKLVRPWVGRDLKVQVEPFAHGFAILVYPEDKLLGLWMMSNRFQYLLRQLEKESGVRAYYRKG